MPQRMDRHPETNGRAIASFVLSLLSYFLLPLVGGILAVVLGRSARKQIRHEPHQTGEGLATAGIVLGWVNISIIVAILVIWSFLLILIISLEGWIVLH